MIRILLFVALVAIGATAATWLADRPGDVLITWQGYRIETSVAVAAVSVVAIAAALALVWAVIATILRLPSLIALASRQRRRSKGYTAVSRGMVAIGAGDASAARRFSAEAERLLGTAPLALLLKAQSAQIRGDRDGAETAFRQMLDDPETRVLGLRGLYVEARRRGDEDAADAFAAEATRLSPAAGWASEAVFLRQCGRGEWNAARLTLDRRAALRLVSREQAKTGRAALLAAEARAVADTDPAQALRLAQDALKLQKDLVPAAALAARLLARNGDLRRAAKVVETAWRTAPHPDLADVYVNLRPGDSTHDRLDRAQRLVKRAPDEPEAQLALAQAALDAREFHLARETLAKLLAGEPTARAYLIAAEIEEVELGAAGKVREWLARAARAPRDPAWIADGVVSDIWRPVAPSGAVGAYRWGRPPEMLAAPAAAAGADDILADHDEPPTAMVHEAAPEAPHAPAAPAPDAAPKAGQTPKPGQAPPAGAATAEAAQGPALETGAAPAQSAPAREADRIPDARETARPAAMPSAPAKPAAPQAVPADKQAEPEVIAPIPDIPAPGPDPLAAEDTRPAPRWFGSR